MTELVALLLLGKYGNPDEHLDWTITPRDLGSVVVHLTVLLHDCAGADVPERNIAVRILRTYPEIFQRHIM